MYNHQRKSSGLERRRHLERCDRQTPPRFRGFRRPKCRGRRGGGRGGGEDHRGVAENHGGPNSWEFEEVFNDYQTQYEYMIVYDEIVFFVFGKENACPIFLSI